MTRPTPTETEMHRWERTFAARLHANAADLNGRAFALLEEALTRAQARIARLEHELAEAQRFRDEVCGDAWETERAARDAENVVPFAGRMRVMGSAAT